MKLLLVYPKSDTLGNSKDVIMVEPLPLEYLAAGVSQRHEVRILDLRVSDSLTSTISAWKPDVVGITGFTFHTPEMLSLAGEVKAISRDIKVVVGGHHATFMPESFMVPDIDIIGRWQCEGIMERMLDSVCSEHKLSRIPGLIYRSKTEWVESSIRPPSVFPNLIPARHLIKEHANKYHVLGINCSAMQMTRGCVYECTFCDSSKFFERQWQHRDAQSIITELSSLSAPLVLIVDDNIAINMTFLRNVLSWLVESKIKKRYYISIGANEVLRNKEVLDKWFELGLLIASIGLERVSDEGISGFRKKTDVSTNDSAVKYWHSRGGIVIGAFITLPTDTAEDFKRLEDYIRTREIDIPFLCILTPLPGTDIWRQYYDKLDRTFSKYDLLHAVIPTTISEAEFHRHFYHLYTSLNVRGLVWKMVKSIGVGTWLLRLPKAHRAFQKLKRGET